MLTLAFHYLVIAYSFEEFRVHVTEVAWWSVSVTAILGAATLIWAKIIYPIVIKSFHRFFTMATKHISAIAKLAALADELTELLPKMILVVKAVLPNSGSSMPDALSRLELAVNALSANGNTNTAISEALLLSHPKAVFRCNELGENLFVNEAYASLLHATTQDLMGVQWRSYVHTEDLEKYDKIWIPAFKEKRSCWIQMRLITTIGRELHVQVQVTVLQANGEVCGFLGMVTEIPYPEIESKPIKLLDHETT